MAAFIPSRRDPEVNETALARVREDKTREARAGYDGAWVAHPDLVPVVDEVFRAVLGGRPNQKNRQREDVQGRRAEQLLDVRVPAAESPRPGCAAISASPCSTSRPGWEDQAPWPSTTLWKTPRPRKSRARSSGSGFATGPSTDDGAEITLQRCRAILRTSWNSSIRTGGDAERLGSAAELLDGLFSARDFPEFLTLSAYEKL